MLEENARQSGTIDVAIDGMSCASCVARVEKAVKAVPGVTGAAVNLAAERARIELTRGADVAPVVAAIRAAGYEPREETIELRIGGMTCASCVGRVEKALKAVPGVLDASVNLATERASVRAAAGDLTPALIRAVAGAGYEAEPTRSSVEQTDRDSAAREAELARLKRSVILAGLATLPLLVFEMGSHLFDSLHHFLVTNIGANEIRMISLVLATIVQFGPGLRFYVKGWPALMRGAPDMNSLVMLGTSAAYGYSLVSVFAPQILPEGANYTYFEAGAVIVTLILLGRWFEGRAKGRTSEAIRRLMTLQAKTARVLRDGVESDVSVDAVRPGDTVVIRPGDRIPVDGEVIDGSSYVDQSMITGEPIPAQKGPGDTVIGGVINKTGAFRFRATKVGADTLLAQIVRTVESAQAAKLPIQALVDQVTMWFVPAVIAAAAATFIVWLLFGPSPALTFALVNAVAVLIIACPCAMGLATPTSIMVGTGKAAEMGVLFRRGEALQALKAVTVVALDKTGTLTKGRPEVTDIALAHGYRKDDVLRAAASLESRSEHPIATAIVEEAKRRGLTLVEPEGFAAEPGFGVNALVAGQRVAVGARRMMEKIGVNVAALADRADQLAGAGRTPLYIAIDGELAAIIAVSDAIKETTPAAIAALHDIGARIVMITGDNRGAADAVARRLGIDEVVAEVLPTDKAAIIERLQEGGRVKVAFVGDGINDAPALARADVGLAIGNGTDIAIESADVVLMSGDLRNVPNAIALSRAVIANIRENLVWAFGYNVVLIPVAAGALYPAFGVLLSPIVAGLAMALSSVSVLANALRLKRFKPPVDAYAAVAAPTRFAPAE